jgi:predicted phosphoribosyltransferase
VLARSLSDYADRDDVVVLALPRGGVPVAYEVAKELGAPLDVFLVRKLGVPGHEELAMGAIASGGVLVLDEGVLRWLGISEEQVQRAVERELAELRRREAAYRDGRLMPDLRDKTVVLVDDGLATGATMQAAVRAVRRYQPARIVVAVPVASRSTCDRLQPEADEVVCGVTPTPFDAVGNCTRTSRRRPTRKCASFSSLQHASVSMSETLISTDLVGELPETYPWAV